jgi:starch synthase
MADTLKILYACSEVTPLAKTGGLGDVASALPRALRKLGHDVRVIMPCYRQVPKSARGEVVLEVATDIAFPRATGTLRETELPNSDADVPLYLIENDDYFDREFLYGPPGSEYDDNLERFAFFCNTVLDAMRRLGWRPDVVNCNDWETCLIPAYLRTVLAHDDFWGGVPTVLTIHNLIYQGIYPSWRLPVTGLSWDLFHADCLEFYGDINLMKAGIAFATKINAVSKRYSEEIQSGEQGAGLDGFLRTRTADITGILNGADYEEWNPAKDPHIPARYSVDDLSGKAVCKRELQKWAGLPALDAPLIGIVSRLVWQKGCDLIIGAFDELMAEDIQIVLLGAGDPVYEDALLDKAELYPRKFRVELCYDEVLAHRIEAGSDFFLMPSQFEPSGLNQLYSLAYGTVPIVRHTGGLADTVVDARKANIAKGTATGIVFGAATPAALVEAVRRAQALYRDPDAYRKVQTAGMRQDFSWERAAKSYVQLYRQAIANHP